MSKNVQKQESNSIKWKEGNPADLLKVMETFIQAKKEYGIVKEQEVTKRMAIDNDLTKYLKKVENSREILIGHLSEQYSIRRESMNGIFERLDRALDENKDEVAIAALNTLEGIIKTSPLTEIDKIGKAFEEDGELEI